VFVVLFLLSKFFRWIKLIKFPSERTIRMWWSEPGCNYSHVSACLLSKWWWWTSGRVTVAKVAGRHASTRPRRSSSPCLRAESLATASPPPVIGHCRSDPPKPRASVKNDPETMASWLRRLRVADSREFSSRLCDYYFITKWTKS